MSIHGLVSQTAGNPTLKRHSGSQLVIDHVTSLCHVSRLEDFTVKSNTESKKSHEYFVESCRNNEKLHRADVRRFSDKELINGILDNKKSLELCGVGAHHHNGAGERERAVRTIVEHVRVMLMYTRRIWPESTPQVI